MEIDSMVKRFSRQLLLSEISVGGQKLISSSRVLIIGCGGLGCPSALYLAAAGVGELGLVDGDTIALDNLHRQIAYNEAEIGSSKAQCAAAVCLRLNATGGLVVTPYPVFLKPENAVELVQKYDVVLDCTDNVATRYLINDACVLAGKPLVSASALRWEGQLTVYDSRRGAPLSQSNGTPALSRNGPCYRCLFPDPPPPSAVGSCSANGVMGPIVGVMGSLQALEALKLIAEIKDCLVGRLLLFDGLCMNFRVVKLRQAHFDCPVCGVNPSVTSLTTLTSSTEVYLNPAVTCVPSLHLIDKCDRLSAASYNALRKNGESNSHVLVDVRPSNHFDVCHIDGAINIPLNELPNRISEIEEKCSNISGDKKPHIITVCRRGNDSQRAVLALRKHLTSVGSHKFQNAIINDIEGGVTAWKEAVDSSFILL